MANASPECVAALDTLQRVFARLGLPVPIEKLEGPWYRLSFLGFELDSHAMEIRLPPAKLTELQQLFRSWVHHCSCTRRELEFLIGKLAHASKVVCLSIWWTEYVLIHVLQVALHHIQMVLDLLFCSFVSIPTTFAFIKSDFMSLKYYGACHKNATLCMI